MNKKVLLREYYALCEGGVCQDHLTELEKRMVNNDGTVFLTGIVQTAGKPDPVKVTYAWTDSSGPRQDTHVFRAKGDWRLTTGRQVRTHWVEFELVR